MLWNKNPRHYKLSIDPWSHAASIFVNERRKYKSSKLPCTGMATGCFAKLPWAQPCSLTIQNHIPQKQNKYIVLILWKTCHNVANKMLFCAQIVAAASWYIYNTDRLAGLLWRHFLPYALFCVFPTLLLR